MISPSDFEPNVADEIEALIMDTSSTAVIDSSHETARVAKTIRELSEMLKHFVENGCGEC
jgi:hypothetical protein